MRAITIILLLFAANAAISQDLYPLPKGKSRQDIHPTHILVKLKEADAARRSDVIPFPTKSVKILIPPSTIQKSSTQKKSSVEGLVEVELLAGDDVLERLAELNKLDQFEYACPVYREQLLYVPNDPGAQTSTGSQGYLEVIKAYQAWDVTRGSTDITIAISDTGMDLDHEDLANKLLDNGDGTYGYDLADADTDASSDFSPHGDRVGGIAGAQADNNLGMAGIAINSPLVPLKVFPTGSNFSRNAYESILYAADKGYDVINLSWGSPNSFTQAMQDIINYAVLEKDLIVIAAAGNSNKDELWYPASYEHVLSVASTNNDDSKASFSTFNNLVDIAAPGVSIYTTNAGSYGFYNGTSFSSPMVAGVAALVKSYYPGLNALQVMERIRVTADGHYNVNTDPSFQGRLGSGRLNAFQALAGANLKSARATEVKIQGTNGDKYYYGDSLTIAFKMTNYLNPLNSITIGVSEDQNHATFQQIKGQSFLELEASNFNISGALSESITPGSKLTLKLSVDGDGYNDLQQYDITLEPDAYLLESGKTQIDFSGNGKLIEQNALRFDGDLFSSEMGLIISTDFDKVADNAPVTFGSTKNDDFSTEQYIKPYQNTIADDYAASIFSSSELGLKIEKQVYARKSVEKGFVITYRIINTSGAPINDLNIGLFNNWDLKDKFTNKARWNGSAIVAEDKDATAFGGMKVVTSQPVLYSNLDLQTLNGNTREFIGNFTDSLKHRMLAVDQFLEAGTAGNGNDIASILGSQINTLPNNSFVKIHFLIAGANAESQLLDDLSKLEQLVSDFQNQPPLSATAKSCAGGKTTIIPNGGSNFNFYADPLGQNLISTGSSLDFGPVSKDSVVYVTSLDSAYEGDISRIDVKFIGQVANFKLSKDTLFINEGNNVISFTDQSFDAVQWDWSFSNGAQATSQHPNVVFDTPGVYSVSLQVTTAQGCTGSASKSLVVATKPSALGVNSLNICKGNDLVIEASQENIRVYTVKDTVKVFEGKTFSIQSLSNDTSFLASNMVGGFESDLELVTVKAISLTPTYEVFPDTNTLDKNALLLINTTPEASLSEWVVNGESAVGDTISVKAQEVLDIQLNISTTFDCRASINNIMSLSTSTTPTISSLSDVCPGDTISLKPQNGETFAFYTDASLDSAISKGQSLEMVVDQNTQIWVQGIDTGIPSEAVSMNISPLAVDSEIEVFPTAFYLDEHSSATFSVNEEHLQVLWYLDSSYYGLNNTAIVPFLFEGEYEVLVKGTTKEGCQFAKAINYEVLPKAPEILDVTDVSLGSKVYPVPTSRYLNIEFHDIAPVRYMIQDAAGKTLRTNTLSDHSTRVSVENLKKGIYFLRIFDSKNHSQTLRFYKK